MILTKIQQETIKLLSQSELSKSFYWTGGTLLATHYLHHRLSEDLDFFSENHFSFENINPFIQELKQKIGFKQVTSTKIFDRWEFLLENPEILRLEFVHYNHEKKTLHPREKYLGVFIDSLDDAATNKTMAFIDRTEPKDVFDIYYLMTQASYTQSKLLELVMIKFGVTFPESLFWSQSHKGIKLLADIKPLMLQKSEKEKSDLLNKIADYFKSNSSRFLSNQFTDK